MALKYILLIQYVILLSWTYSEAQQPPTECCYDSQTLESRFKYNEALYAAYMTFAKWPTNKIHFDVDLHMDPVVKHFVAKAIEYFDTENDTCVSWEQHYPDGSEDAAQHWVTARNNSGGFMSAALGWNIDEVVNTHIYINKKYAEDVLFNGVWGNVDYILTDKDGHGIAYVTALLHEIMHVMGFHHEQQRANRDCWVFVSDTAILEWPDAYEAFSSNFYYSSLFPYDYKSVMHYPEQAPGYYAHDSRITLGRKDGQLSDIDLYKVNYVYCDEIAWCDLYFDCAVNFQRYQRDPNCFREGPAYNNTKYTCGKCTDPQ